MSGGVKVALLLIRNISAQVVEEEKEEENNNAVTS